VAVFMPDDRMHLLLGFTTDPQGLLAAVESKRDNPHFATYDCLLPAYQ
jgi:hypothetical protein